MDVVAVGNSYLTEEALRVLVPLTGSDFGLRADAPSVERLEAAGVVLLVRLLGSAVPEITSRWEPFLMAMAGISILYGSLCAIPQRGLKRLMGYSSIANAGFVMIGLSVASKAGSAATLFYLAGYLFAVLAAFLVVAVVIARLGTDEIAALSGLHRRSPLR